MWIGWNSGILGWQPGLGFSQGPLDLAMAVCQGPWIQPRLENISRDFPRVSKQIQRFSTHSQNGPARAKPISRTSYKTIGVL